MGILSIADVRRDTDLKGVQLRGLASIERAAEKDLRVVISTGSVDRYNSVIEPGGWNLEQYNANPVVLWMHDYGTPAIARSKVALDGDRLVAVPEFPERGVYPLADTVQDLVRGGFLNAASVGWQADEWTYDEKMGGVRYIKQTLLEWSFVTVPGNAEALVERAIAAGVAVDPLRAHAEEILRRTGSKAAEAVARAGEARRTYVWVRQFGDDNFEIRADSFDELTAAAKEMVAKLDPQKRTVFAPAPAPAPIAETRDDDQELPDTCKCGHKFGADDKYCAMCGTKRAVEDEDEVDADRVLAAIESLKT